MRGRSDVSGASAAEQRGWKALEHAIANEDLSLLRQYAETADRADPNVLSNPLDAQARHCYYRLSAAASANSRLVVRDTARLWPEQAFAARESEVQRFAFGGPASPASNPPRVLGAPIRLTGPMGPTKTVVFGSSSSRIAAAAGQSVPHGHAIPSAGVDVRAAVALVLARPSPAALHAGGGTLAAREGEERDDIAAMELYELQIIEHLAHKSTAAVARRACHQQLVQLEMLETAARCRIVETLHASTETIDAFLLAWRHGPVMAQNNFLMAESLRRHRLRQDEDRAWAAIVADVAHLEEQLSGDWWRLQRLQRELSRAALLHQRVAIMDGFGGARLLAGEYGSRADARSAAGGGVSQQKNCQSCAAQ